MRTLRGRWWRRLDERGLGVLFAAFFLALAVPAAVLVAQAYGQLKWEAFRNVQVAAEELAARVDTQLKAATAAEEARTFGDYSFLVVTGDADANFVQRSPLSAFPIASAVPGILGYFQVDAGGRLTTPLLPAADVSPSSYGIGADEQAARAARVAELRRILAQNRLLRAARDDAVAAAGALTANAVREPEASTAPRRPVAPAASPPVEEATPERAAAPAEASQAAFDRLASGSASASRTREAPVAAQSAAPVVTGNEPLALRQQSAPSPGVLDEVRQKRVEKTLVPEPKATNEARQADASRPQKLELGVRTFQSEVDPFELGMLDTGHLVLFRNVWREGQRYIQGALIDREAFLAATVDSPYRASAVAGVGNLAVTYQGRPLVTLSAAAPAYGSKPPELAGSPLYRARLSPPFGDVELAFVVSALPRAPGSTLLGWITLTLAVVLCGGFFLMYRFAVGQLRLARQQQDFVSAVSHELKTPLTSIRMYGEMLRAGWADEAKKRTYYDYIHSESERLSRLIDNVLQLARLTRSSQRFDVKRVPVAELIDMVRSKVATQIERAGFTLRVRNDAPADAGVDVDADCFAQIFINLVDNALKFAAAAPAKAVEIGCRREQDGSILFTVRDFGPGVPKTQMKKIFELFYRPENELTRETVGTGIGLALVRQLAAAMRARIDVRNCEPGAEFRLTLSG
jgi:signal transduction histidine kinase